MKQPGVEVQAVYTVSGERTNITYYSDVRVSDDWRIGEVDRGWDVMTLSLQDEHSSGFASRIRTMLDDVEAWAHEAIGDDERPRIEGADVRRRLARAATELEVATSRRIQQCPAALYLQPCPKLPVQKFAFSDWSKCSFEVVCPI